MKTQSIVEPPTPPLENQPQWIMVGPKIKFCLFPLSDRPTKIAATQNFIASLDEKSFF
jgi:hypothetical protein